MACVTASSFLNPRSGWPGQGINIQAIAPQTNKTIPPSTVPRIFCFHRQPAIVVADHGVRIDFEAQLIPIELERFLLVLYPNCCMRHFRDHSYRFPSSELAKWSIQKSSGIWLLENC